MARDPYPNRKPYQHTILCSLGWRRATTRETATYLRRSPHTLERWRCRGSGPTYFVQGARMVVYDLDAVDAWLEQGRRSSTSEKRP